MIKCSKVNSTLLLFGFMLTIFLNGCLPEETPCNLFKLEENVIYSNNWNVDSVHFRVSDTTQHFFLDTTYRNTGTWKFNPDISYQCGGKGAVVYTTIGGTI